MARNKCADEMIREMVMRHGVSVTIRPAPMPERSAGNCCKLVMQFGERNVATIIDYTKIDYSGVESELLECEILMQSFEKLFVEPFRQMINNHFYSGGDRDAR